MEGERLAWVGTNQLGPSSTCSPDHSSRRSMLACDPATRRWNAGGQHRVSAKIIFC